MIKFTNGLVLDKDFNIIKEDVFVDGDSIVAIGEYDKTADTVYDINGNLLMPSFKNAHTHSAVHLQMIYRFSRGSMIKFFRLKQSLHRRTFTICLPLHFWNILQAAQVHALICITFPK